MTQPNSKPKGGPRGKSTSGGGANANVYVNPFTQLSGFSPSRIDMGVDYCATGGVILAVGTSAVTGVCGGWPGGNGSTNYINLKFLEGPFAGLYWYIAEDITPMVTSGIVQAGEPVAKYGPITGTCNEMGWGTSTCSTPLGATQIAGDDHNNTAAGHDWADFMTKLGQGGWTETGSIKGNLADMPFHKNGGDITGSGSSGAGTATGGGASAESVAKAAAFATFLNLPGLLEIEESLSLQGERSLMNDQPLLPAVEQICQASLRNFQSMPNGNFFAFYPDYFGGLNHRTPYWEIHDIEIIDGQIQLSDDALSTHVYVVGDTMSFDGQVSTPEKMFTAGVVTVFNAFMADFLNGVSSPILQKNSKDKKLQKKNQAEYDKQIAAMPTLADKDHAISFLKKYGARPLYQEMPMIRSHYYELFYAYQTFCLFWSKQFLSRFEFTFMPELFPGGIISFPEHGIQCYVDEVVHQCDYTNGFTTQANLSAPAALKDKDGNPIGNRPWVNQGMVRAGAFAPPKQPKGKGD